MRETVRGTAPQIRAVIYNIYRDFDKVLFIFSIVPPLAIFLYKFTVL